MGKRFSDTGPLLYSYVKTSVSRITWTSHPRLGNLAWFCCRWQWRLADNIPAVLTDSRCRFPLRQTARHIHLNYAIVPRDSDRDHTERSIIKQGFLLLLLCTHRKSGTKCMWNVYVEKEDLPDVQHSFLSQWQHFKSGMLESNGCFQLCGLLHLLQVTGWTEQIFANGASLSFLSAVGQPQWLSWHGPTRMDHRRMSPHEDYKCVVARRFVNEVALPTTSKSWKARPAVLRTQWEILLGGIWSATRSNPPPATCLGKIYVLLTPAPRSCRCKREELMGEAGICGTLLHSCKELDELWADSIIQTEQE